MFFSGYLSVSAHCGIDDDVGTHVCPFVFDGYIRAGFWIYSDNLAFLEKFARSVSCLYVISLLEGIYYWFF
jgi:hypothetical protein